MDVNYLAKLLKNDQFVFNNSEYSCPTELFIKNNTIQVGFYTNYNGFLCYPKLLKVTVNKNDLEIKICDESTGHTKSWVMEFSALNANSFNKQYGIFRSEAVEKHMRQHHGVL